MYTDESSYDGKDVREWIFDIYGPPVYMGATKLIAREVSSFEQFNSVLAEFNPTEWTCGHCTLEIKHKADIEYLKEKGYITDDDWCPKSTIPHNDRRTIPVYILKGGFCRK